VVELNVSSRALLTSIHIGPYNRLKCPACNKNSFFNIYSSVKDPITWPKQEKTETANSELTEEMIEKKRIEESKYEKP
jgi:hypothetical protein